MNQLTGIWYDTLGNSNQMSLSNNFLIGNWLNNSRPQFTASPAWTTMTCSVSNLTGSDSNLGLYPSSNVQVIMVSSNANMSLYVTPYGTGGTLFTQSPNLGTYAGTYISPSNRTIQVVDCGQYLYALDTNSNGALISALNIIPSPNNTIYNFNFPDTGIAQGGLGSNHSGFPSGSSYIGFNGAPTLYSVSPFAGLQGVWKDNNSSNVMSISNNSLTYIVDLLFRYKPTIVYFNTSTFYFEYPNNTYLATLNYTTVDSNQVLTLVNNANTSLNTTWSR